MGVSYLTYYKPTNMVYLWKVNLVSETGVNVSIMIDYWRCLAVTKKLAD